MCSSFYDLSGWNSSSGGGASKSRRYLHTCSFLKFDVFRTTRVGYKCPRGDWAVDLMTLVST